MDDLDQYVNWDNADANIAPNSQDDLNLLDPALGISPDPPSDPDDLGLVLENDTEDGWSFCALQHFSGDNFPGLGGFNDASMAMPQGGNSFTNSTPLGTVGASAGASCTSCALGNLPCEIMREGNDRGTCTTCAAQGIECSFGSVISPLVNPSSTTITTSFDSWLTSLDNGVWPPNEAMVMDKALDLESNSLDAPFSFDGVGATTPPDNEITGESSKSSAPPKIGARFSRESVRLLKNWLQSHTRHPYPSDEEKELLQRQTGLNKTQITNWLANARRRGKVHVPRSTSPHVGYYPKAIDIPRRGTPTLENMNPLQRWEHSPPEHEPASVTAIARAVTASSSGRSSALNSPRSINYTDDGSSASSMGTSRSSNGSLNSARSYASRESWGSLSSAPFNGGRTARRRRRRATPRPQVGGRASLSQPLKTFQCTFCTDTFRTKHDWQRHEKSLHLSLERWVCAPEGPRSTHPETGLVFCVFCGAHEPDDAHIETHNHLACRERSLGERTFYRKDHLNQHLRLVHDVKFVDSSMKQWQVAAPEIKSRCGFCGIMMDSWSSRVDHLAEHFKTGNSMAHWNGDWGFDPPVADMVENAIPPYLIHQERATPFPYAATQTPAGTPRSGYELIKMELASFALAFVGQHQRHPSDDELALEGSRIIFASELLSLSGIATEPSWLRDLIMKSPDIIRQARFGPVRSSTENRMARLKINGKDNLFEECPMENQLRAFAQSKTLIGITPLNDELQLEACKIVGRVEGMSTYPSDAVANWLIRMIISSQDWLEAFRMRAHMPRSEDIPSRTTESTNLCSLGTTIHSYSTLEQELDEYVQSQRSLGVEPSNADLQRQARLIIYEVEDAWNQTAADNAAWLECFRARHDVEHPSATAATGDSTATSQEWASSTPGGQGLALGSWFFNDSNCCRRLGGDLRMWVASVMSPNNPLSRIPTDQELQYQARWILYNGDDPWNQTPADNVEWLTRFKRDVHILNDGGPGLSWDKAADAHPNHNNAAALSKDAGNLTLGTGDEPLPSKQHSDLWMEIPNNPDPELATILCSREFQHMLGKLSEAHFDSTGRLPPDAALTKVAKILMKSDRTGADDPVQVERFKTWMEEKLAKRVAASMTSGSKANEQGFKHSIAPIERSGSPSATSSFTDEDVERVMKGFVQSGKEFIP